MQAQGDSVDDIVCCFAFLPVQAVDGPLHGVESVLTHDLDALVVVVPEWESKQLRGKLCGLQNQVIIALQFFLHLCYRQFRHMRMAHTMHSDFMTGIGNGFGHIRVCFQPNVGEKKRRFHIMRCQHIQYCLCMLTAPGCIKGNRQFLFVGLHKIDWDLFPLCLTIYRTACIQRCNMV